MLESRTGSTLVLPSSVNSSLSSGIWWGREEGGEGVRGEAEEGRPTSDDADQGPT